MVVAIDGPAGTGKSTVAQTVAAETRLYYVNSGNLYRAITLIAARAEISTSTPDTIVNEVRRHNIDFCEGHTLVDGHRVDEFLRSDGIDSRVAQVSSIPAVRDIVNKILRKISTHTPIIVEGRDMTTVVFPDAEVKIFLDATIDARAGRRYNQGTSRLSLEEIRSSIAERDAIDRNKAVGALIQTQDAVYLDTSHLTIDEVCAKVMELIQRHI